MPQLCCDVEKGAMLCTKSFEIIFGKPEHGWLPLTIITDEDRLELSVSDVPVDPIAQMLEVVENILEHQAATIYFSLEPTFYQFQCLPLSISEWHIILSPTDHNLVPEQPRMTFICHRDTLMHALLKALDAFAGYQPHHEDWSQPFPSQQYTQLKSKWQSIL